MAHDELADIRANFLLSLQARDRDKLRAFDPHRAGTLSSGFVLLASTARSTICAR